jgi:hypothetical protein
MHTYLTYRNCESAFNRRAKGRDFKAVMRGCHLIHKKEEDEYHLIYVGYTKPVPICKINRENVLTLLTDGKDDITIRNRLTWVLHTDVFQDVSRHGTKESPVRISAWHFKEDRCKFGLTVKYGTTIPCHVGLQFQMGDNGVPSKILNPIADAKILVKKPLIQEARKALKEVFDTMIITNKLGGYNSYRKIDYKWNFEERPTDSDLDAIAMRPEHIEPKDITTVYLAGLLKVGMWSRASEQEMMQTRAKAVAKAMQLVRQAYYRTHDGFERVELTY